ncbi:hypothetical protein K469DRAFT_710948 [Zopfia rhizophila CBS 207.26]|uniref:Uncharacterized protein n=1 Tax=Zopfia rhizophila CBS 207.26 TaxID=1314779 RepID=A0A6A6D683_9PEZI|nr:hypothetical protein K469DRAFT_703524 [Zopfia rhizophila CBS 207.26]KAF2183432.1 hypothetical protein K469DRAFT_710948 [Zopfia rhizophila CBS 207.26]
MLKSFNPRFKNLSRLGKSASPSHSLSVSEILKLGPLLSHRPSSITNSVSTCVTSAQPFPLIESASD